MTIYQVVLKDGTVAAEFENLGEARNKAVELQGRIQIDYQTKGG